MVPDHDASNKATHGDADGLQAFAESTQKPEKKSAAQQLVELALDCYDLGVDPDGKAFGVRKGGHVVRHLVNGRFSLRKELGGLFYRATGRPASQNALAEAVAVLEAEAENRGEPVELFLRAARPNDDTIYIDMGDKAERVLRITPAGWEILDGDAEVPVLFRRTSLTAALPTPERGGDLEQLWQFVNMKSEDDRQVLRGWLVGAYALVGRPCPILALLGEQGTAKTSSIRCAFSLVDPTTAPVRRPPNDADSYLHAVNNSRGTAFDNLSSIQRWMSDAMCRTVTGDSDVGRTFYTNGDAYVIKVQGILGFTGIDVGALAGDLAERCVWGELEVIKATERRSERELDAAWALAYPSMLGGLLDLVVAALAALPSVALTEKPRMADFAEVLAALDVATGANGLEHYTLAQESVAEDIVGTDKFLMALGQKVTERWEGTGKELYELLPRPADDKYWPEPRGVSGKMRRSAPDLRKAGWTVDEIKPDPKSKRPKRWVLVRPGADRVTAEDVAVVQAARQLRDLDVARWTDRLVADGMPPEAAAERAAVLRESPDFNGGSAYKSMALTSRAIDDRFLSELRRLGLTLPEFDRIASDGGEAA